VLSCIQEKLVKSYVFKVVIEEDEFDDGRTGYSAYCPAIEAAVTWGETEEQALQRIDELVRALVQMSIERGEPVPTAGLAIELESPAVVVNV
jgi:predicted RNase H-like HicB family nuclease